MEFPKRTPMLQPPPRFTGWPSWSCGILLLLLSACSRPAPRVSQAPVPPPVSSSPVAPVKPTPAATPQPNPYDLALDRAASARSISKSAQSPDDWVLVAAQWQDAIALLKTIPASNPQAKQARAKIQEFQRQLADAKQRSQGQFAAARLPTSSTPDPEATYNASQPRQFRVPILYRLGNTPVISVTFNGSQTFPMILDTGASGTVITRDMAQTLAVKPTRQAVVNTASDKGLVVPVGTVNSAAVGNLVMRDLSVAIAGPQLDIGLLGHNFFDGYDLIIRRNYVEFQAQ